MIGVTTQCLRYDEEFYENPNVFQPFRFAEMHEENSEDVKCYTRLETLRDRGFLKDFFKRQGCWRLSQRLLTTVSCPWSFKVEGFYKGVRTQK